MADKIEHISEEDFLNDGRVKINKFAIDPALRAENNSLAAREAANTAHQISGEAKDIAANTEGRLDNIVAGEMQDSEVIDARKPFGSDSYPTLSQRLDNQIGKNDEFRSLESEKSFMNRINDEMTERGINVKWFGAKGDGTDCTDALISVFDLANQKGLSVIFPAGEYVIADELEITADNISVTGIGKVTIEQTASNKKVFGITNASNITIKNLEIKGNAIRNNYYPTESTAIYIRENNNDIVLDNLHLSGFNVGVDTLGGERIHIENCKIDNMIQFDGSYPDSDTTSGYGIELKNSVNAKIENCTISAERHCLYFGGSEGCKQLVVDNCTCTGMQIAPNTWQNTREMVIKIRRGEHIIVRNSTIRDGFGGIATSDPLSGKLTIDNCLIEQTVDYSFTPLANNGAIHIDKTATTSPCAEIVINNCVVRNFKNINALWIDNAEKIIITNCEFDNNVRSGYLRPNSFTSDNKLYMSNCYFDNSAALQIQNNTDGGTFEFIKLQDLVFSNSMYSSSLVLSAENKTKVVAQNLTVLGSATQNAYQIALNGNMEISNGYLRFYKPDGSAQPVINFDASVPANTKPTKKGTIAVDANYLYIAIGDGAWRRVPLQSY